MNWPRRGGHLQSVVLSAAPRCLAALPDHRRSWKTESPWHQSGRERVGPRGETWSARWQAGHGRRLQLVRRCEVGSSSSDAVVGRLAVSRRPRLVRGWGTRSVFEPRSGRSARPSRHPPLAEALEDLAVVSARTPVQRGDGPRQSVAASRAPRGWSSGRLARSASERLSPCTPAGSVAFRRCRQSRRTK